MSYTVVNDWGFLEDAILKEGMAAIRKYMKYLKENEQELKQSLWLYSEENPLRYFHIASYKSVIALQRQMKSKGMSAFIEQLYPLIDPSTVVQAYGPVMANTGCGPDEI